MEVFIFILMNCLFFEADCYFSDLCVADISSGLESRPTGPAIGLGSAVSRPWLDRYLGLGNYLKHPSGACLSVRATPFDHVVGSEASSTDRSGVSRQ
jgi:hypothetical protein